MLHFPTLRTRRLQISMRELGIGDAIAIASMAPDAGEATNTAFLRFAVGDVTGISDPALWTVQERMLAICHYLAVASDDGPDFSVGESAHYSDYLEREKDTPPDGDELGTLGGDTWHIRHLTGAMAEAIERLQGEVSGLVGRTHWLVGAMAAQLVRDHELAPDATVSASHPGYDDFLLSRMRVFAALPESDFTALLMMFFDGRDRLMHFFAIDFSDDGIVAMPVGGVTDNLSPARFPASACITSVAVQLAGKP